MTYFTDLTTETGVDDPTDVALFASIVSRTKVAFGASVAQLYVIDPESTRLVLAATTFVGDATAAPSECRPINITGPDDSLPADFPDVGGLRDRLSAMGVQSYYLLNLRSPLADRRPLGTFGFGYRTAKKLSSRERSLAHLFAENFAHLLYLQNENYKLTASIDVLSSEFGRSIRHELLSLLAHDLGHLVLGAQNAFEVLANNTRRVVRGSKPLASIADNLDDARTAIGRVLSTLSNLNNLFKTPEPPETQLLSDHFILKDVIEDIISILEAVLRRNNMSVLVTVPEDLMLWGSRNIFMSILFNLLINSIEAQQSRRNPRRNAIHIHGKAVDASADARMIELQFWDEGPGINRHLFLDPQDIFEMGKTSKRAGSGAGLAIARNLLNAAFGGDIVLMDARTAMFRLMLPRRRAV